MPEWAGARAEIHHCTNTPTSYMYINWSGWGERVLNYTQWCSGNWMSLIILCLQLHDCCSLMGSVVIVTYHNYTTDCICLRLIQLTALSQLYIVILVLSAVTSSFQKGIFCFTIVVPTYSWGKQPDQPDSSEFLCRYKTWGGPPDMEGHKHYLEAGLYAIYRLKGLRL